MWWYYHNGSKQGAKSDQIQLYGKLFSLHKINDKFKSLNGLKRVGLLRRIGRIHAEAYATSWMYTYEYTILFHGWTNIPGNITRSISHLILPGSDASIYFRNSKHKISCNKLNKFLRVHTKMVIDPWDREKQCLRPLGLGITIPFPRVNNHFWYRPFGYYSY